MGNGKGRRCAGWKCAVGLVYFEASILASPEKGTLKQQGEEKRSSGSETSNEFSNPNPKRVLKDAYSLQGTRQAHPLRSSWEGLF